MAKTIRKTIQITTRKRNNSVKINEEFYSYDKKNAQFEFIMDYDVPADKVIALFHFENSNRYYETLCEFKGNLITIEFDTSLILEDELVTGYLYFDKLDKSTDVYRFTFGARLSEIDKTRELPIQEKVSRRIVPVADIVTKQELEELMDKIKKNGGTYDDTEIRNSISSIVERVQTLENKPDNDTRYDDSDVKSRLNVLETNASRYLTEHQPLNSIEERIQQVEARFNNLSNIYLSSHQSLEHLATKDALDKIEQRVEQLESKPEIDVTNFATNSKVTAVESRVLALENKPTIDTNEFAKKSEIPQGYDDSALSGRVSALEAKDFVEGKSDYHLLKHQVEELVKQNQVLQEQLALVKPAPRRAPMAYTLDKSSVPWTIWFDNGCGLQLPSYAETATIYGYGQSINLQHKEWYAFPLVGNIISLSRGILTLDNVKNTVNAIYWAEDTTVLNPIKNKDDYTWITARCGEKGSKHQWAWEREANIVRVMYQLGIWDAKTVESLGAVKR